jgi:hypothetical protein
MFRKTPLCWFTTLAVSAMVGGPRLSLVASVASPAWATPSTVLGVADAQKENRIIVQQGYRWMEVYCPYTTGSVPLLASWSCALSHSCPDGDAHGSWMRVTQQFAAVGDGDEVISASWSPGVPANE